MTEDNQIQAFTNKMFGDIRTTVINDKPYFCGSDIAKALGYTNPQKALKDHCKEDGVTFRSVIDNLGRHQNAKFINEGNLYRLIINSKLPNAEDFEYWIFDTVLPQIRITGGYIPLSPADTEQDILAKAVLISQKTIENKDKIISNLETRIQDLEPKAQAYIDMMTAQGYLQFIDVAGMVEIGRNTLMQFLRKHKVLTKQSNFNIPYNRFRKNGYFKVICGKTEQGHVTSVTMVSPKGLDYIYKLIHKYNAENDFDTSKLLLQEVSA